MKKLLLIIALAVAAYVGFAHRDTPAGGPEQYTSTAQDQFGPEASNTQVQGVGVVERILADDNDGSRHQRFLIRLQSGQTLLVAHNIDLAPRVSGLREGDTVEFNGEYAWNQKGGVVHWTHRDPGNHHVAGWLRHNGQTFQ